MIAEYIKRECGDDYKEKIMNLSIRNVRMNRYSLKTHDGIYQSMLDIESGSRNLHIDKYVNSISSILLGKMNPTNTIDLLRHYLIN